MTTGDRRRYGAPERNLHVQIVRGKYSEQCDTQDSTPSPSPIQHQNRDEQQYEVRKLIWNAFRDGVASYVNFVSLYSWLAPRRVDFLRGWRNWDIFFGDALVVLVRHTMLAAMRRAGCCWIRFSTKHELASQAEVSDRHDRKFTLTDGNGLAAPFSRHCLPPCMVGKCSEKCNFAGLAWKIALGNVK